MGYKKIYESQYGERKLIVQKQFQFLGLGKNPGWLDLDRYDIAYELAKRVRTVLDVGCGSGYMLTPLMDKYDELYGIDIAPSRLEEAKKIVAEKYDNVCNKFILCEGNVDKKLDFESDFFDTIICLPILEHVYDIYFLVKELYRILRPGSYVIGEVPNIAYLKYHIKLGFGFLPTTSSPHNLEEIGWDGGHIHYFSMRKLCELFESPGFKVVEKTGSGFLAPFRNWWPSLLTGDLIIKATK
jgi:SAM-dependent methyltransferase